MPSRCTPKVAGPTEKGRFGITTGPAPWPFARCDGPKGRLAASRLAPTTSATMRLRDLKSTSFHQQLDQVKRCVELHVDIPRQLRREGKDHHGNAEDPKQRPPSPDDHIALDDYDRGPPGEREYCPPSRFKSRGPII
jgi:hypothetical protein